MKKFVGVFVVLILLILPGFSQAEEEEKGKESVTVMEEVVVTASRVKEKKKEVTSNITIMDEEEIKNSSAKDLGELLTEKGIGHSQRYPGALNAIGIRGFRTETHGNDLEGHVLILVNGRRAGTGNTAKIMTKNIERVEIIRGPASVQYGSAAMGGVVNVITRQGKKKPTVFVEGLLGSYDCKKGSAGFSGKYKAVDFSAAFTTGSMNDYDTANGERYYNTGYNRKENSSLNLGYEFLPGNRIGVIYNYFDVDHVGNPGYLSSNDLDNYADKSNKSIDFIYDGGTPDGPFSWKARYFDGKDKDKWVTMPGGTFSERKTDNKGAQAQVSYNQEYFLLTAGFDWVNYEIETTWDPKNSEYDNPAYFLLAKTRLFDKKLIITGGIRYDDYEVDMKSDGGKKSDDHISPRVGAAYLLTDWLKLRANFGEAFMMPSAKQLAGDFSTPGYPMYGIPPTHYLGNPNLKPEKSETYEGGIDFSYASFDSSLTYFHTDYKDKIQTYTTMGGDKSWKNLGKAEIEGIEGNLSYDVGSFFSWDYQVKPYVSFTYLTKYKDKETDKDLTYTSDIHVSYGITISDLDGFSANLNLAYTGKQDITYPSTMTKGSFTVANFTVSKKIIDSEKYGGVTLRGEIQNLFDKDYSYVEGYPMPGRSFFLGLRYDF